jgi:Zn finger protein HypA/HybF involved in hydrogenase expression
MISWEEYKGATELQVLRCGDCGDTFSGEEEAPTCPPCGSGELRIAEEPLL